MIKKLLLLAAVAVVLAATAASARPTRRPRKTAAPTHYPTAAPLIGAKLIASKLGPVFPTAFTMKLRNRVLYATMGGTINMLPIGLPYGSNSTVLWAAPPGFFNQSWAGSGILGLTVDETTFARNPLVFFYVSNHINSPAKGDVSNEVWCFRVALATWKVVPNSLKLVWRSNSNEYGLENGGYLKFGADGMLYVAVGHGQQGGDGPANSEKLSSDQGKIHRITRAGKVPADNPIKGSSVYAWGIRNAFGLAWDPVSKNLWETEPGPDCADELNHVVAGASQAWGPNFSCKAPPGSINVDAPLGAKVSLPKWSWEALGPVTPNNRPPTPTGIQFCNKCGIAAAEGKMVVGFFHAARIEFLTLNAQRDGVNASTVALQTRIPVVAMETDRDGNIYYTDSAGNLKQLVALLK